MRINLPLALLCSTVSTCTLSAGLLAPNSPAMLGDWNGLRPQLAEQGYDFTLKYVGEVGSNLGGGYDSHMTARWSDQLILGVTMDLQKLWAGRMRAFASVSANAMAKTSPTTACITPTPPA